MFPNFEFVRPESLNEAVRELQGTETAVFAGGTELLGAIRDNIGHPKKLVSISGIRELSGITRDRAGTVHIGTLTTLSELQSDGDLKRHYSALAGSYVWSEQGWPHATRIEARAGFWRLKVTGLRTSSPWLISRMRTTLRTRFASRSTPRSRSLPERSAFA